MMYVKKQTEGAAVTQWAEHATENQGLLSPS